MCELEKIITSLAPILSAIAAIAAAVAAFKANEIAYSINKRFSYSIEHWNCLKSMMFGVKKTLLVKA